MDKNTRFCWKSWCQTWHWKSQLSTLLLLIYMLIVCSRTSRLVMRFSICLLSIEWNTIRIDGPVHRIVNCTQNSVRVTFLSVHNWGLSSYWQSDLFQINRRSLLLLCFPPLVLLVSILSLVQDFRSSELSNNRGLWPFDWQVAITPLPLLLNL